MAIVPVFQILSNPHYGLYNPNEDLCFTLEGRTHDDLAKEIVLSSSYYTDKFNSLDYKSYLDFLLYEFDYIKIGSKYSGKKVIIANKDAFCKHKARDEMIELFKLSGYEVEELDNFPNEGSY